MLCIECEPEDLFKAGILSEAAKLIKSTNSAKYYKLVN
jgi:hypothetical protein